MEPDLMQRLLAEAKEAIVAHGDELTALDQAIGDGDHGVNMKRGFEALAAAADEIAALDPGPALQKAGMTLVMSVGGASGPLYGTLLMAMGKALPAARVGRADVAAAFAQGVAALAKRGKSEAGEKTMLEVLLPVAEALSGLAAGESLQALRDAADRGLAATKDMKATRGRASFLGDRSIGHLDPGARSSALLVHTLCDVIEGKA